MKDRWVLEIIIDLPIGFPINNIISLWVGEVNVHDFFESMSTSTVDINRRPIFFWYESISTVDIDRFFSSTVDFDRFLGEIDGRSNVNSIFK